MTDPVTVSDRAMRTFLIDRLEEEREAARRHPRRIRGMEVLDEVLDDLRRGATPDQMTCDLLLVAYAGHEEFEPAWNRWRPDASGFVGEAARA